MSSKQFLFLAVIIAIAGAGYFFLNRADLVPATAVAPVSQTPVNAPTAPVPAPQVPASAPEDTSKTAPTAPPITPVSPDPNCTQFSLVAGEWVCTESGE